MKSNETVALSREWSDADVFVLAICARFGNTEVLLTPTFARELEVAKQEGAREGLGE